LRNGAASEPEDKSLLDPPEVSDLPITTPEVLQAKRKLVIEGMKADRNHFTVRPYPEPAALHIEPRPPVESTVEPAAPLEIVEEAPPSLTRPLIEIVEQPPPESPTTTAQPTAVETEPPAAPSLPPDEDHVSSDWKLRIGITSQLGAYVLRYPWAIEQLRSNGFRAEYFGCDHAFLRDLFDITRLPADQWNRGLAELQRKYPAEHSRYLRLGEHLPALSSEKLAEYFIPLAGIIQPNPAPVETDIERIN